MDRENETDAKMSRRSFVAALFAAATIVPAVTLGASDAEALESVERQFTGFRHKPRTSRSPGRTRGGRRRRIARVRQTGRPQPHADAPAQ